jgi:hypothetical protein
MTFCCGSLFDVMEILGHALTEDQIKYALQQALQGENLHIFFRFKKI